MHSRMRAVHFVPAERVCAFDLAPGSRPAPSPDTLHSAPPPRHRPLPFKPLRGHGKRVAWMPTRYIHCKPKD
eukprot:3941544-Rhodomonas_salina.2